MYKVADACYVALYMVPVMDTLIIAAVAAFAFLLAVCSVKAGVLNFYYKDTGFYLRLPPAPQKKHRGGW